VAGGPRWHSLDLRGGGADVFGVNKNTLGWILVASSFCVALTGYAAPPKVESMGNDTYTVTRVAKTGFVRHTDELRAEALDDAAKFCADQGKQLKVVTVTESKPKIMFFGYANAGDPELKSEPAPAALTGGTAAAYAERPAPPMIVERPLTTDELYSELTKLDDLRKKGILTDEEFQSEKRKVLNRSK
jgi:hypothetical protein